MEIFSRPSKKLTDAMHATAERLEELERGFKRIRLEWEDTFDKLQAVVQRIAKRAQTVEKYQQEHEQEAAEPDTAASLPSGLTPSQRAAQLRILERRSRTQRPS